MDMKLYPAIFKPRPPNGYSVRFFDIPGCRAQGDDTEEATQNARDTLGEILSVMEAAGQPLPEATPITQIRPGKDEFFIMVTVDMDEYRKNPGKPFHKKNQPVWPKTAKAYRNFYRKH